MFLRTLLEEKIFLKQDFFFASSNVTQLGVSQNLCLYGRVMLASVKEEPSNLNGLT